MFLHLFFFPFCFLLTHPSTLLLSSYSLLFFPYIFHTSLLYCLPMTSSFVSLEHLFSCSYSTSQSFFPSFLILIYSHLIYVHTLSSIFLLLFLYSVLSFYTSSSPPPTASVCLESVIKQKTPHVEGEIEEVH